jgi:hypothetical protein
MALIFFAFRLFQATLAQSQRKTSGTRTRTGCFHLPATTLASFSAMYGILSSSSRTRQRSYNLKSRDPTLIEISRQYVAHPSLPPSLLLEFSHILTVFPGHQISIGLGNWTLNCIKNKNEAKLRIQSGPALRSCVAWALVLKSDLL